ncbi:MAG: 16S rRNA (cytosine(1402)-N(4))-methyltransferase RsmH [Alphaproteobacteria bacterium]|nr:16S rRNA (cytosine(1402)-N(4))-methyltransferase RsmH [Alphaproteobacteria bacterium]MBO7642434.1 16S rRNA (cytosine(1402)-N(4))-methyltransferase RsmH [Alphaproteobacteria bacterium]
MSEHIPVLLNEVLNFLDPSDGKIYFDGTFGGGGYSRAILEKADCSVIACDRDELVIPIAKKLHTEFPLRFSFFHSKFSDIKKVLAQQNIQKLDGIVLDLGLSNFQLEDESRGFSFKSKGNVDMTMGLCDETAMDIIHRCSEEQLANIIYTFSEERFSRRIAKNIKKNLRSIKTAEDLANAVRSCVRRTGKIDQATKTFQALRIFVNRELEELKIILNESLELLNSGGKIVVVSFHSLEDRIVKSFFKECGQQRCDFQIVTKKPIAPSEEEIEANPKSRSAKLRCLLRL